MIGEAPGHPPITACGRASGSRCFRRTHGGDAPVVAIGDAVVTSTQFETSLMRIEKSREAIQVGDLVGIHR